MPKLLNRVHPGRAAGRELAEHNAHCRRKSECNKDNDQIRRERNLKDLRPVIAERVIRNDAEEVADQRKDNGFDQELGQDKFILIAAKG